MNRRTAIVALAATFTLMSRQRTVLAQALDVIRVSSPPTEGETNLFYAIKNDLFRRVGIDAQLISSFSGSASTAAVISGTYEMARTSTLALFLAHLRDIPITIVAPDTVYTSGRAVALLQVATDSPIRNAEELNGKIVGVASLNDQYALAVRAWVDARGGDWKSLKFVEAPLAAMEPVITSHRVDAGILQTPVLDTSLAAGTTRTLGDVLGAIAPRFMYGAYVARQDWAAQHGDVLRRFNRVLGEATVYVNGHPNETAAFVAELTKVDVSDVAKLRRALISTQVTTQLVQPAIDAAAKYGTIAHVFPAREVIWGA